MAYGYCKEEKMLTKDNRPPIGMGLLTICVGLISLFGEETSWSQVYGITVIGGAGLGCMFSSAIIALQASAEPRDIAVVTGLGNFSRILGGALGVAISSAILNSSLAQDLPAHVPADIAQNVLASSDYVRHGCPPQYMEVILKCYLDALRIIWYVMTAMCGAGFFLSLLIKSEPVLKPRTSITGAAKDIDADTKVETPPASDVCDPLANHIHEGVTAIDMKPANEFLTTTSGSENFKQKS